MACLWSANAMAFSSAVSVRARQKFGPTPNVPPTFVNLQKRVHDLLAPHEFHTTLVDQGVTAVVLDYSRVAAHAFFTKSR